MKLKAIIIILSLLGSLSTSAVGYLFYSSVKERLLKDAHDSATGMIKKVAEDVDRDLEQNRRSVGSLARMNEIKAALSGRNHSAIAQASRMLDLFRETMQSSVTYLMTDSGIVIASSNRGGPDSFVGKNYAFRPYFTEAMAGRQFSYMALGVTTVQRGIYYSAPVKTSGGRSSGVVAAKSSMKWIEGVFANVRDGVLLMSAPEGVIFISSRQEWNYKSLWRIAPEKVEEIRKKLQFGAGSFDWAGLSRDGDFASDGGGNRYMIHEETLKNFPGWKVIYLHDMGALEDKLMAPLFRSMGFVVLGICLFIGGTVAFLYREASEDLRARAAVEEKLRDVAVTDDLTGLYNRRGFFHFAERISHVAKRSGKCMNVFFIDLDGLKDINDRMGHKRGDEAIRDTADILRATFRKSDVISRVGGDEFAVLTVCASIDEIDTVKSRIQAKVDSYNDTALRPFVLSLSVGAIRFDGSEQSVDDILREADKMMYAEKAARKNQA